LAALRGNHDFKGFTKARVDPAITTRRTLDAADLDIDADGDALVFTFKSQGFLWEQVRRMVAFLIEHHADEDIEQQVHDVLDSGIQPNLEPATPGGLILWDVDYGHDITWQNLESCDAQFLSALKKRYVQERTRGSIAGAVFTAAWQANVDKDDAK